MSVTRFDAMVEAAVNELLESLDYVPDNFRYRGQTLRERVEAWVEHAMDELESEIDNCDCDPDD